VLEYLHLQVIMHIAVEPYSCRNDQIPLFALSPWLRLLSCELIKGSMKVHVQSAAKSMSEISVSRPHLGLAQHTRTVASHFATIHSG
jgi:hypothetical protein